MPTPRREQEGVHLPMDQTDTLAPNRRDKGGSPGLLHTVGDFGQEYVRPYGPVKAPTNTASGRPLAQRGIVAKNPPTTDQPC